MSFEPLRPGEGPVVVVGGGIVGLSCAWFLRAAGADVIVFEAAERTCRRLTRERGRDLPFARRAVGRARHGPNSA